MNTSKTNQRPNIRQRMALMKGWTTEITINASQKAVWEQVTSFDAYSEWNPFVREAHATFEVGETIRFLEDLKQFGSYWLDAKFLAINPFDSFVWKGHFAAPFLFSVRHSFIFEPISENKTRFKQVHENSGFLIPYLALRGIYCVSHQGYLDYNKALKKRCEEM